MFIMLVFLNANLHSEVFTGEELNTEFTIHGRAQFYNGDGAMRIWIVGSKRMLSVVAGDEEYKKIEAIFSDGDNWFNRTIYGEISQLSRLSQI